MQLSVLQRRWGRVQVRLYHGNDALEVWTFTENIVP
jgi:hypothetical protein